ncbi:Arylsulfatase [Crateriforma conspicua]|uniref:Arylsulfatase n=1 Tax=Crateriforma conspicua TaxID=2527996 RepID=A0A5C5XZM8_9PLAN|nr:Arylsulfatase [Crateriforma conspicua]
MPLSLLHRSFCPANRVGAGIRFVGFVVGCLFGAGSFQAVAEPLPNIVIVYADDMGYGDLAVQNADSKIPTPNLDRLASEGMRFTDAHSSSGICTPSRYALLTGRYHWRKFHGIVNSWGESVFDPQRTTLPEMLKSRGYATACIGKWHLGWDWAALRKPDVQMIGMGRKRTWPADAYDWSQPIPDGPLAHGFDHYFGDDVPNFPPYAWIKDDRVVQPPTVPYVPNPEPDEGSAEGRPGPMVDGWRQDDVMPTLTEHVVQWVDQTAKDDRPFFLYWPWTSPHAPIIPTEAWKGKTNAGPYGDFMAQSDHHLGQLLNALDQHGLTENTLLVFSADNGPEKYAYERIRNHDHRSAGPLRGLKRDIWEGGHRVPMLIRWPGHVQPGTVNDGLISQVDLFATVAAIVGAEVADGTAEDSHDQTAMLRGEASARESVVHNTYENKFAFREGDWVLVDAKTGNHSAVPAWFDEAFGYAKDDSSAALYRLSDDLSQHDNLIDRYPDKADDLRAKLNRTRTHGEVRPLK